MTGRTKKIYWLLFLLLLLGLTAADIFLNIPFLIHIVTPLLFAGILSLIRLWIGPGPADRIVAFNLLGFVIAGFCALMAIYSSYGFFMDIAIAWLLQSFVTTLAFAKYLEGKNFGE